MSKRSFIDTKGKFPLTYRVVCGESIQALCRTLKIAKAIQEMIEKDTETVYPIE